ncbi:MAG: hypothetical protein FLDDKLPJ_01487 [Phycisphaerae bacterium]|nr:hypothetical protein [Phycisphaerae bacterium]
MAQEKEFDGVEMKNRIQAEIQRENEGLSDQERREKLHRELETSDDPLSRKWREWKMSKPAPNRGSTSNRIAL